MPYSLLTSFRSDIYITNLCSQMCSTRLAEKEQSSAQFSIVAGKQPEVSTVTQEESDDDTGSVELECRENMDAVNEEGSGSSDEERMENRVFPQQRFSPVPLPRRSLTPDIGTIRHSPVAFVARRAITPDISCQNQTRSIPLDSSSWIAGKSNLRPLQAKMANKSADKYLDQRAAMLSKFVKPKLPTTKCSSPGLTISGHFQPTGNVFKPNIQSRNSDKCKQASTVPLSSQSVTVASYTKDGTTHFTTPRAQIPIVASSSKGHKGYQVGNWSNVSSSPVQQASESGKNIIGSVDVCAPSFSQANSRPVLTTAVTMSGLTTAATKKMGLFPLSVSIAAQPPVASHMKGKGVGLVLSPKGAAPLKPIAPLLTTSQVATGSISSGLLKSSPGTSTRILLPAQKPVLHGSPPGAIQRAPPGSTPSTNWHLSPFAIESAPRPNSVSPLGLVGQPYGMTSDGPRSLSPNSVAMPHTSPSLPGDRTDVSSVKSPTKTCAHKDTTSETVNGVDTSLDSLTPTNQKTILKRFIPDGMEE